MRWKEDRAHENNINFRFFWFSRLLRTKTKVEEIFSSTKKIQNNLPTPKRELACSEEACISTGTSTLFERIFMIPSFSIHLIRSERTRLDLKCIQTYKLIIKPQNEMRRDSQSIEMLWYANLYYYYVKLPNINTHIHIVHYSQVDSQ